MPKTDNEHTINEYTIPADAWDRLVAKFNRIYPLFAGSSASSEMENLKYLVGLVDSEKTSGKRSVAPVSGKRGSRAAHNPDNRGCTRSGGR